MQKLILLLTASFLLTACGIQVKEHKMLNIHPDAQPYVLEFQKKSGIAIDNLQVTFRHLEAGSRTLGYCQRSTKEVYTNAGLTKEIYKTPLIVINLNYWNSGSYARPQDRELLMFHELGHCILNKGHDAPNAFSIMRLTHLGGDTYMNYYGTLIGKLFGVTSYAGNFDSSPYIASTLPEFEEPEIEVLTSEDLKGGCVHETHEVIHLDENGNEIDPNHEHEHELE